MKYPGVSYDAATLPAQPFQVNLDPVSMYSWRCVAVPVAPAVTETRLPAPLGKGSAI